MNRGNKLNKALKDALEEHKVPLREPQWDRLSEALAEQKPKATGFPALLLIVPVLLIALLAAYFTGKQSARREMAAAHADHSANTAHADNADQSVKSDQADNADHSDNADQADPEDNSIRTVPSGSGVAGESNPQSGNTVRSGSSVQSGSGVQTTAKQAALQEPAEKTDKHLALAGFKIPEAFSLNSSAVLQPGLVLPSADSIADANANASGKDKAKPAASATANTRFALSFSGGYAPVNTALTDLSNPQKLHKDSRYVFESTLRGQHALFGQLGFEWLFSPALNLGLSGGLQYREVSNRVDFTYKHNEIPFKHPNGDIAFYFYVHDTMAPHVMDIRQTNTSRYLMLPLSLSYGYVFGGKHLLQISAGLNLSAMLGSDAVVVDLNQSKIRPSKDLLQSAFNLGYSASLLYSRKLYKAWWLGAETRFQHNGARYNLTHGVLKSSVQSLGLGMNLRYTF